MKSKSMMKVVLAVVLSVSLLATGCSAQWISVALADLPVLTEMALNIASLVATLQSGKQLSPAEATAIQSISAEASRDLNLLETLYKQYKASPSAEGLEKIEDVIATINTNLPALLTAAHIGDPTLSARISAAVNLILTTVTSFASLIPETATPALARSVTKKIAIPNAGDLKRQWNLQVCGPTGRVALDAAFAVCVVK
jgi:hypothetical protein